MMTLDQDILQDLASLLARTKFSKENSDKFINSIEETAVRNPNRPQNVNPSNANKIYIN